jgi:hypothetical protein
MLRNKPLLALILSALFFIPGCPKDEKKKDDDKEEKSSKKKKGDDDDDDDKPKKKKKKADDEDDDDKGDKGKKKKADDDDKAASDDVPKVGIKACDDYLDKLGKCAKKAPAAAKDGLKTAQTTSAKAWKEGAKQEAAKDTIKKSCENVLKSAKDSYKAVCPGVFDEE